MSENNNIITFNTIFEALDYFIEFRLIKYQERKDQVLTKIKSDISVMTSKAFFIMSVIKGDIEVNNKKKEAIISQLEGIDKINTVDSTYDYLLRLPIYSLTNEKFTELKSEIQSKKDEYNKLSDTSVIDIWITELDEIKG
jgi:DNA topoisomerase-2